MNQTKWFLNQNNYITGPYSPEDLQEQLHQIRDGLTQSYVWSRGLGDWIQAQDWSIHTQYEHFVTSSPSTITHEHSSSALKNKNPESALSLNFDIPEDTQKVRAADLIENIKEKSTEKFRVQLNFVDQPDMTREELLAFAARQDDVSLISVYDKKDQEWKELYSFPEIVERLGISRRRAQRVPFMGQFIGKSNKSEGMQVRIITISAGGIGLTDCYDLSIGDMIYGQITSPHFYTPITIEAEVTYSGLDGYTGLKFTQINDEGSALVSDYVKKFGKDSTSSNLN